MLKFRLYVVWFLGVFFLTSSYAQERIPVQTPSIPKPYSPPNLKVIQGRNGPNKLSSMNPAMVGLGVFSVLNFFPWNQKDGRESQLNYYRQKQTALLFQNRMLHSQQSNPHEALRDQTRYGFISEDGTLEEVWEWVNGNQLPKTSAKTQPIDIYLSSKNSGDSVPRRNIRSYSDEEDDFEIGSSRDYRKISAKLIEVNKVLGKVIFELQMGDRQIRVHLRMGDRLLNSFAPYVGKEVKMKADLLVRTEFSAAPSNAELGPNWFLDSNLKDPSTSFHRLTFVKLVGLHPSASVMPNLKYIARWDYEEFLAWTFSPEFENFKKGITELEVSKLKSLVSEAQTDDRLALDLIGLTRDLWAFRLYLLSKVLVFSQKDGGNLPQADIDAVSKMTQDQLLSEISSYTSPDNLQNNIVFKKLVKKIGHVERVFLSEFLAKVRINSKTQFFSTEDLKTFVIGLRNPSYFQSYLTYMAMRLPKDSPYFENAPKDLNCYCTQGKYFLCHGKTQQLKE